ncbi:TPA: hypothetical protein HA249_06975 [Candidatus Woesearchaeota archaeon]|nr:hypothetical protein [Candidatus Woesearchaeota archaeon]
MKPLCSDRLNWWEEHLKPGYNPATSSKRAHTALMREIDDYIGFEFDN